MNEVWLAGKFSTRSFRREVSEAMRGGDVGSQAEVTEAEMEAMIDMILGSYFKASRIAVLCLGSSRKAPGPFKIVTFTVTVALLCPPRKIMRTQNRSHPWCWRCPSPTRCSVSCHTLSTSSAESEFFVVACSNWVCSTLRLVSRRAVLTLQQEQRGGWETIVTEAPS